MPDPAAEDVCQLIEAGEIRWAFELTRNRSLIYLAAEKNPSENYLALVLAAAEDGAGSIDEISSIDLARAFLITALAPNACFRSPAA